MHLVRDNADFRSVNMYLEYLAGYGPDHHSRAIVDLHPMMIQHNLPNLVAYFDSRLVQTEKTASVKKGLIREKSAKGIIAAPYWISHEDNSKILQKAPIEQEIKLEFIDIPKLHSYDHKVSQKFFEALAETEDMCYFETKAIKKFIEFKWPLVLKYTVRKLFLPFLAFQMCYMFYMNFIYLERDEGYYYENFVF
jgi:hypothetical protein